MKILYLAPWFPFPPDNGSRIRLYHLLRALGQRHEIMLLAFVRDGDRDKSDELDRICREVQTVPWRAFDPSHRKALLGFLSPTPRSLVDTFSAEMASRVTQLATNETFDMVIASTIDTAEYAALAPTRVRLLEEHNSMTRWMQDKYRNEKRSLPRARAWFTFAKYRRYESRLYARFDACTMVSELDARAVAELLHFKSPLHVVPNGVDVNYYAPHGFAPQGHTLVFNGSLTYAANLDAVEYFLDKIFPLVKQHAPDVCLQITGRNEGVRLEDALRQPGITLTGYLDDIRPTVGHAWVCVAPIRTGGGTRLKILEAMALGTPVISTTKGAEGLNVTPGQDVLLADNPTEFAERILDVFDNAALRARLSANARRLVETQYDWNAIGSEFCALVEELGHVA